MAPPETRPPGDEPRPLRPEDERALARLAARAFPQPQASFVRPGREVFVVEADGGLAAAVILRVIAIPGGTRIGYVAWAMTDPDHQGRGLASALVARGIDRLHELGCTRIVTEIEGHNTASEAVFRRLGFRRLAFSDQLAAFGLLGAGWLRLRTGYTGDPGHFLWMQGAEPAPPDETLHRVGAWGLNWAFALLALAVGGGLVLGGTSRLPTAADAGLMLAAVALLLGAREAAMRATARAHGLPVAFRAWDSGLGITAGIALLFGSLFPAPGGVYPREREPHALDALGAAALAGTLAVAALVAASLWVEAAFAGSRAGTAAAMLLFVGKPLVLFDAVMAFPPFQAFNARRIYALNRGLWAGVAALGLALFLL